jgi:Ion channel
VCADRSPELDGRRVAVEIDLRPGQRPPLLRSGTNEQRNDQIATFGKRHRRRRADPVSRPRGVPHCWHKLWWALQTVTTVGYGDVTPENAIGRVLGAIIMLESIAFVAIITAAITSSFVEWARREQTTPADLEECLRIEQLAEELADIKEPLEQMQRTLDRGGSA